jgi:hypothetical protein
LAIVGVWLVREEVVVDQFYEKTNSLFVEAYDAFYAGSRPQIAGDVAFYELVAREGGGPVLELGCGTGRIEVAPQFRTVG